MFKIEVTFKDDLSERVFLLDEPFPTFSKAMKSLKQTNKSEVNKAWIVDTEREDGKILAFKNGQIIQ